METVTNHDPKRDEYFNRIVLSSQNIEREICKVAKYHENTK